MLPTPTIPQVSVLLPCHNAAGTVEAAIRSITDTAGPTLEIVAVDDGSSDGTLALLQALAAHDPRVHAAHIAHAGIVATLQHGLSLCRAPLVARMDADDISHPGRLQAQVDYLSAHPHIGLVASQVNFGNADLGNQGYAAYVDWINSVADPATTRMRRFVESPFAHPSVCFLRELVEKHGGYREGDFPEDYELWLRWLDAGVEMAKLPQALLTWNDSPERLSRTDGRYRPEAFYRTKAPYIASEIAKRKAAGDTRSLWIWGAGRTTRKRVRYLLAHCTQASGYIDVDPSKVGKLLDGMRVIAPQQLPPPGQVLVLVYVGNRGARDIIQQYLDGHGYREGLDYLLCA